MTTAPATLEAGLDNNGGGSENAQQNW